MSSYITLIVGVGVFAIASTYLTAAILPIPVWVTLIAWASLF
jgi:hypothetical protein